MRLPLGLALRITIRAIRRVFGTLWISAVALVTSGLMLAILVWGINANLLWYISFDTPLSMSEKLRFFIAGFQGLPIQYGWVHTIAMLVFSSLFGIQSAMLIYTFIHKRSTNKLVFSGGSVTAAAFASSCSACGTSLLTPALTWFGVTATPLIEQLSAWSLWIGILFCSLSIYLMSKIVVSVPSSNT